MKNIGRNSIKAFFLRAPLPDEHWQIEMCFDGADHAVSVTSSQLTKLRLLKTGLRQDLLTGRVSVMPLLAGAGSLRE